MKRYLVTGGSGFIGKALLKRITKNNVGMFVAFSIPAFVMLNVNGPGVLKGALISSLLLYAADQMLNRRRSTVRSIDK